jgi:hypothetical protein
MEDAALLFGVVGAFVAFVDEHKRCGELEGGRDGGIVWLSCSCGGHIAHSAAMPSAPLFLSQALRSATSGR